MTGKEYADETPTDTFNRIVTAAILTYEAATGLVTNEYRILRGFNEDLSPRISIKFKKGFSKTEIIAYLKQSKAENKDRTSILQTIFGGVDTRDDDNDKIS